MSSENSDPESLTVRERDSVSPGKSPLNRTTSEPPISPTQLSPSRDPNKGRFMYGIFGLLAGVVGKSGSNQGGADETSDDEEALLEDEDYIRNGHRGVIVFTAYCVNTDTNKTFHIHLYSGQLFQYTARRRKKFYCSNIQSMSLREADHNLIVDVKKSQAVGIHQKRFMFETDAEAFSFQKYVEFRNDAGQVIRMAFDLIDRKGTKVITANSLRAALNMVDLSASEDDIKSMLLLKCGPGNGEFYDFHSFFHLFMDNSVLVSNLRECLQEWLYQARFDKSVRCKTLATKALLLDNPQSTLQGEELVHVIDKVRWCVNVGKSSSHLPYPGAVYVTNFRIIFVTTRKTGSETQDRHSRYDVPAFFSMTSVPLTAIWKIQVAPAKVSLNIFSRDFRVMKIYFHTSDQITSRADVVAQILREIAFRPHEVDVSPSLFYFAFKYRATFKEDGWKFADLRNEYARQGLTSSPEWKIFDNSQWQLSDTYPQYLALPSCMSDADIISAASHRSKHRLPAISYRHAATKAVLTRSAQPLVGLNLFTSKTCEADSALLNLYRLKGIPDNHTEEESPSKFYILDARREIAATLQRVAGKGTEDVTMYSNTELIFFNIDNVHVMRSSAACLGELLLPGGLHSAINSESGGGGGFFVKLEESGWLRHLRLILLASVAAAEKLHLEGASVLIHCSDGWDRTSQVSSLTQILLDPYYRTITGMAVLIEKDWCSFGHKFRDRCGGGEEQSYHPDERSPVFLQFLDTVFQVMEQFPTAFEYNGHFLTFLADHVHSSLFGTFLANSDKERRVDLNVCNETVSVWSYVLEYKERFSNYMYRPYSSPIWPCCTISKLKLWDRYFLRWDPAAHPNWLMGEQWHDDWGNGLETSESNEDVASDEYTTGLNNQPSALRNASVRYDTLYNHAGGENISSNMDSKSSYLPSTSSTGSSNPHHHHLPLESNQRLASKMRNNYNGSNGNNHLTNNNNPLAQRHTHASPTSASATAPIHSDNKPQLRTAGLNAGALSAHTHVDPAVTESDD